MAQYAMDLRTRVLRDAAAGLSSKDLAAKYAVSRAWVDRLKQRQRDTGEIAPRKQTTFRRRTLTAQQEDRLVFLITARPDATLTEQPEVRAALKPLARPCAFCHRLASEDQAEHSSSVPGSTKRESPEELSLLKFVFFVAFAFSWSLSCAKRLCAA